MGGIVVAICHADADFIIRNWYSHYSVDVCLTAPDHAFCAIIAKYVMMAVICTEVTIDSDADIAFVCNLIADNL